MELRILYFGDIVGRPGRETIAYWLPQLREQYLPDLVLANGENASHGHGLSEAHYRELSALGIDAFTTGDHIWQTADLQYLDSKHTQVVRPANYRTEQGKRFLDLQVIGKRVRLVNLLGRVFMAPNTDNAFHVIDEILATEPRADIVLVDFHAEATSEKRCFAEYVDGRASLVVGTHTHVPTADAQILPNGTAFISDLGMTGPKNSSLGAEKLTVINSFLTGQPWRYSVAEGECELGAVFTTINIETAKATSITHIRQFTEA